MISVRSLRNLLMIAALGSGVFCAELPARSAELEVEEIGLAPGRLEGVRLVVDWPREAKHGRARLAVRNLEAPALGYRWRDLTWECELRREPGTEPASSWRDWSCAGPVRAGRGAAFSLQAQARDGSLTLTLGKGKGRFSVVFPAADKQPLELRGERMPAQWLQSLLATRWSQGQITAGTVTAVLALQSRDGEGTTLRGPLDFQALGLDSRDGRIASAGLSGTGQLELALKPAGTRLQYASRWNGGELLLGDWYAALPPAPVRVELELHSAPAARWELKRLAWEDADVLQVEASGLLDPGQDAFVRELQARFSTKDLGTAVPRYFDSLLATLGAAGLEARGATSGRIALGDAQPSLAEFEFQDVTLRDRQQRFALEAASGDLRWSAGTAPVESAIAWRAARLHELPFGPARLALASSQGELRLREAATLPLFQGSLRLDRFAWQARRKGGQGAAFDLALTLQQLDLALLSQALGWPAFPGTLSGRIPGARYADQVLSLEGGLDAAVFDGRVRIGSMTLERPFGVAPTLSADIDFSRLDLEPLTSVLGFGEISGRLDGRIGGLRVVDWSPVAFDADFHTTPGAAGPRRISRRAVNDLSRVGGGGVAAGLQNQMLKLFDTFGYSRIGLRCRLANNVCHMDGLDSSGAGYAIVEGAGLPRITVVGHQRQVDWPVLVARLKAATAGQAPIID